MIHRFLTLSSFSLLCALWSPPAARAWGKVQWVTMPAGSFVMGGARPDQLPAHRVTLKSFAIAKSLVTFRQYRACVAAGVCTPDHAMDGTCNVRAGANSWKRGVLPASSYGERDPAVCINLMQAKTFSDWVGGRLPSEAEWEYAARSAGQDQRFPWGDKKPTCKVAVMEEDDGSPGCGQNSTWPVCSKPEGNTRQGLCDMAGDAWEWTTDSYHPDYVGAPADGRPWTDPSRERVIRGGSWYTGGGTRPLRARFRGISHDGPTDDVGFRPVLPASL